MTENFSPTGYWAHYLITFTKADGTKGSSWTEVYPVIGAKDDEALVIDEDGTVKKVTELLAVISEGGDDPDQNDGETHATTLAVAPYGPGE